MKRASRRLTVLASMAAAVMLSLVLSPTPASAASTLAWSCPSGNVCVWEDTNGEGSRCNWDVADPDWYNGNIVCSWADDQNARSAWNRGTSSEYESVRFYTGANYSGDSGGCLSQGGSDSSFNMKLRSHRWRTSGC